MCLIQVIGLLSPVGSAVAAQASDTFSRDVSDGLGTSEIMGIPWELVNEPAAPAEVTGSEAHWSLNYSFSDYEDSAWRIDLGDAVRLPVDFTVTLRVVESAQATQSSDTLDMWLYLTGDEFGTGYSSYGSSAVVELYQRPATSNFLNLYPYDDRQGGGSTYTDSEGTALPGFWDDQAFKVRMRVDDQGTYAKAWFVAGTEPADWQIEYAGDPAYPNPDPFRWLGFTSANVGTDLPLVDVYVDQIDIEEGLGPLRAPSCDQENLSDEVPAAAGGRVSVKYDPRFLAHENRPDFEDEARDVAVAVQARTEQILSEYGSLGLNLPGHVGIEITCRMNVVLNLVPTGNPPGITEGEDKIKLRADLIASEFYGSVNTTPGVAWRNLVDHELFHSLQFKELLSFSPIFALRYWANGSRTVYESGAVAAQDLLADTDDRQLETQFAYLNEVADFFTGKPPVDITGDRDSRAYEAAPVLQYWGERFGPAAETNLERRVARFLADLADPNLARMWAVRGAMGGHDPYDALRDFFVTAYARRAPNMLAPANQGYRLLDEVTVHGGIPGTGGGTQYPSLITNPLELGESVALNLDPAQGDIYELPLPGGAQRVRIDLDADETGGTVFGLLKGTSPVRTGFVSTAADGTVVIDPRYMPRGPKPDEGVQSTTVSVVGASTLAVVLASSEDAASLSLTVTDVGGDPSLAIQHPSAASPLQLAPATRHAQLAIFVIPQFENESGDPEFAPGLLADAFDVEVDGISASVTGAIELDGRYVLFARPAVPLNDGTHDISVDFAGASAQANDAVVVGADQEVDDTEAVTAWSLGELDEGATASATATLAPATAAADFSLTWQGSEFDLSLLSPLGRVITEAGGPGVEVTETPTSVSIRVADPEPGEWQLTAFGVDVPAGPEEVTYAVTESDTPVRSQLFVDGELTAGTPLDVSVALTGPVGPLTGAQVSATLTALDGSSWTVPLTDDGGSADSRAADGVYGASVWGTQSAGSYTVRVTAAGTDATGREYGRLEETSVVLAPMQDADGDGVADSVEPRFGLDPAVASDGGTDHDGDGLGLAAELAAGTDPWNPDTDRGGESDASEEARSLDARDPSDDAALPHVLLSATAVDGNAIAVAVAANDSAASIELYRLAATGQVLLGTFPSNGTVVSDGPLPAGDYGYAAVAVLPSGAEGAPVFAGPAAAASDVTPPVARIEVNGNVWDTNASTVEVEFFDASEPSADMRLATSLADLDSTPWVPFQSSTTIDIGAEDGIARIYAQLRDGAGNVSEIAYAVARLDTIAPASVAGPLLPVTLTPSVDIPYVTSDEASGVAKVQLWYRFRPTELDPWGDWRLGVTVDASPVEFAFTDGIGVYEFYTRAIDNAGNHEAAPPVADTFTRAVTLAELPAPGQLRINQP